MPDLLLEFFGEEIPARMQARAADDLKKLITDGLVDTGLTYESARAFTTPRRLTLAVGGIPVKAPDSRAERKGPRVDAPEKAITGFLRAAGLQSVDQAERRADPKKGEYLVAVVESAGRPAVEILADLIPDTARKFPWPKSMRWGARSQDSGALKWVRPLHGIVATFGPETEEPDVVSFDIDGIASGDVTYGHRFHAPEPIRVRRFDDYVSRLEKARVILDAERRADIILHDARDRALALGLELVEDAGLLAEVAGLVEWPVVLVGRFEDDFLHMPDAVIRTSIRSHQKCFVLRDPKTAELANRFLLVANLEAADGGAAIVGGNERVIRARLADAQFFWQSDLKVPLQDQAEKLQSVVFHDQLGSQSDRVERVRALARDIARQLDADAGLVDRAALLAKADLVSQMVGEFPELQGLMGRLYALSQNEDPAVAGAIEDHYRPQGPSDGVPTEPVAIAVALADKLDMLVGFWAIGETPTGSKDPYALRRAALGVIRILLVNDLPIAPRPLMEAHISRLPLELTTEESTMAVDELCAFLEDRLKVQLRQDGARHDLVDAVLDHTSVTAAQPVTTIVRRVEALGDFLETDDGANLLAGYRRAANILRLEEKKDGRRFDGDPRADRLIEPAEADLAAAIAAAQARAREAVEAEDFAAAMQALAALRGPVDRYFDDILVNAEDPDLRENRLNVLNQIRHATRQVAEFSKIS